MVFVSSESLPTPPWSSARAPRQRRTLNRDLIVDTAMAIVDEEGLDGLSMRRLADRLGTGPASLYAHVSGRDELLMLLLERAAADIVIPDPEPERWQEQVSEVAYSMRDALLPHRDLAGAALANIPTGEHAMRFADRLLAVLLAGGVDRRHAAMVIDLLPSSSSTTSTRAASSRAGSRSSRTTSSASTSTGARCPPTASRTSRRCPRRSAAAARTRARSASPSRYSLFITGLAAVTTTTGRP